MMKRKPLAFAVVILLFNVFARADVNLTFLKGEALGESQARLVVMVFDELGRPIKGLSKEHFKVRVDGEEIIDFKIAPVSATESPLTLVLGVDVSGSMRGRPFTETKRSISRFLDQLDRSDYISLMSFGTTVTFLTDFTAKRFELREKVRSLSAGEQWTHLYDAAYEAVSRVQAKAPTAKKAVVILTDGKDEQSQKTRQEALASARDAHVPIFAIGFGHLIDREYLRELARISGGYFLYTPDPEEIGTLYDRVLDILKNDYAVDFTFAKEPGKYMANLVLDYRGSGAEIYREFVFNPLGAPVIITEAEQEEPSGPLPWLRRVAIEWWLGGGLLLLIAVFLILWFRAKASEKKVKKIAEEVGGKKPGECQLEFLQDGDATQVGFVASWLSLDEGIDATRFVEVPDVYLEVDGLPERIVPLVNQGAVMLDELIVARKTGDTQEQDYRKRGSVYLSASSEKMVISRPKKDRPGHARIFLADKEKYVVEDLGSKVGTFVNDKPIKDQGSTVLKDGDVVEVGGKTGLKIVYKKSQPGSEGSDKPKTA